jgi:hypothetical protein
VNPVNVGESSGLSVAQAVTFQTMRTARDFAAGQVSAELVATFYPEDAPAAPDGFAHTPHLEASVLDHGTFAHQRKLPLIKDILDQLYEASEAKYLIYTNVDISLQPHFYLAVERFITQGYDALVINRRTIPDFYTSLDQLPLMYAELGKSHRGWDCFVFRREAYPHYRLGNVCVGAPRIGLALIANLISHAKNFKEFKDQHLTFHIGDDRRWSRGRYSDYANHNTQEVLRLLQQLEHDAGPFDRRSPPGAYLFKLRTLGRLYEWWSRGRGIPLALRRRLESL